MIISATSGSMSGYQQAPSYGGFDPRWSNSQPVGYDPNMPYPSYDMERPYFPAHDPQTVYGASAGYFQTGDPRYLHPQASYLLSQPVPVCIAFVSVFILVILHIDPESYTSYVSTTR